MSALGPAHRYRPTPLHASRAGVAAVFCVALCVPGLLYDNPLILAAVLLAAGLATTLAGGGADLARIARFALPVVLLIVVVNALISRSGTTVIFRGGEVLGWRLDVTLEAVAYGGVMALRLLVLVVALALLTTAVDPDRLLRLFRRVSYRSALTASLAIRLVPTLTRDAKRMRDAARCRPRPPGRTEVARAALRGALDRAVDVAAALELRGYAQARRPPGDPAPWSRHDFRVAGAAAGIATLSVAGALAGVGRFDAYPEISIGYGPVAALVSAALIALALMPFMGASARLGVARA